MARSQNDESVIRRLLNEREAARADGDLLARALYACLGTIPVIRMSENGPKRSFVTKSVPPGKRWFFPSMDKQTWGLCLALYHYMYKQGILTRTADFYYQMSSAHSFAINLFSFLRK